MFGRHLQGWRPNCFGSQFHLYAQFDDAVGRNSEEFRGIPGVAGQVGEEGFAPWAHVGPAG